MLSILQFSILDIYFSINGIKVNEEKVIAIKN